jgi:hypothetical protein
MIKNSSIAEALRSVPSEFIRPDMHCPRIGTEGMNWSRMQCIIRIAEGNPCIAKCKHAKSICDEYRWNLDGSIKKSKIEEIEDLAPKVRKKFVRVKRERNKLSGVDWKRFKLHERKWGQEELWERNRDIFITMGQSRVAVKAISNLYNLSQARASQIVMNMCEAIDPTLFKKLFTKNRVLRFSVFKFRRNVEKFMAKLPREYPKFEESKDVGKTD